MESRVEFLQLHRDVCELYHIAKEALHKINVRENKEGCLTVGLDVVEMIDIQVTVARLTYRLAHLHLEMETLMASENAEE